MATLRATRLTSAVRWMTVPAEGRSNDSARRNRKDITLLQRWFEGEAVQPMEDFKDPKQEWRRLFSELLGTFFLVLVAAGGGMMG